MEDNKKRFLLKWKAGFVAVFLLMVSLSILTVTDDGKATTADRYSINIKRIDPTGVDFSIPINDLTVEEMEDNGEVFQRLSLLGCGHTAEYGKAELPALSFYVAVPQGAKVKLSYDASEHTLLQDYNIYPSQPPKPETQGFVDPPFKIDEVFYSTDAYYPETPVEISPIMIVRGCRIVMVTAYPVAYNPANQNLKMYKNININVDFIGGTGEFIPERLRSPHFQPLFDAFLLNAGSVERASMSKPAMDGKSDDRADLLIVVYDSFYEEILPLAEWRHKMGIETKVVRWSDIGTTAADLRTYVSNAYHTWELPPSFLLIVGDADHVPVNYLYNHPYHYDKTGTDHWYVTFDGGDYLPELHCGRISIDNEAQLETVVEKILDYSKTPYMAENWFNNVLLAAYEEYGRYFVWGSETVYEHLNSIGYNVIRQYEGGNPPGSTTGVINAINDGVIIANHRDHGDSENYGSSYTGWSHPRFDTTHIQYQIANGRKYPVMFAIHCNSGWFDGETDSNPGNYESIGEVGIRVADKGFVAVIASSRVSYSGYNDELGRGFYDGMFPDFDPYYPGAGSANPYDTAVFKMSQVLNYGKFWMYDKYIVPGGCWPYPWTPTNDKSRAEFEMFHVHGDPTMEVWTAYPESFDVTHQTSVPLGSSEFTVHVEKVGGGDVEDALVCLLKDDEVYLTGISNSNGDVTFNPSPSTYGTMYVTVTKHNYLPYEGEAQAEEQNYPDPDLTYVTLTDENLPGLTTCPAGDGSVYQYAKVAVNNPSGNPLSGIPADSFQWIVNPGVETQWYGTFDVEVNPVDPETNYLGEIRFEVCAGTSIVGDIVLRVEVDSIPINDVAILPSKSVDYEPDGDVDLADFTIFGNDWGTIEWRSDFNWDGNVDLVDFVMFGQHWGHIAAP